jgi:hypothetical protein
MARSCARSFQILRHVLTSSRRAAILFVFIYFGGLLSFFLSRLACFVALRYAVGFTPCFDWFGGFSMSPLPSCPELACLVELRCTPCFDRLGDFPCPLLPHALSLLLFQGARLHTLHPLFRQVQGFAPSSCPELMMTQSTPISKLFFILIPICPFNFVRVHVSQPTIQSALKSNFFLS